MNQLPPDWAYRATGDNGGKIVGSCKNTSDLLNILKDLLDNSQTVKLEISKRNRNYNPMISPEDMMHILNTRSNTLGSLMWEEDL